MTMASNVVCSGELPHTLSHLSLHGYASYALLPTQQGRLRRGYSGPLNLKPEETHRLIGEL